MDSSARPTPPQRPPPAAGVREGIRNDVQAAKEGGTTGFDPRGVGAAWTHNFLNLKPWHPANFRNRTKVWEAEQAHYAAEKRNQEAKEEFETEQEYMKTLSMLSTEEQEKYRARQSVAFLYTKPPGLDAAMEKAAAAAASAGAAEGKDQQQQQQRQQQPEQRPHTRGDVRNGGNHLAKVISGYKAATDQQLQLKRSATAGRSPPRGGGGAGDANQQFVVGEVDSEEEDAAFRLALMPEEEKQRLRREARRAERRAAREAEERARQAESQAEERRLEEAKAFLRAAGLEIPEDGSADDGNNSGEGERSRRRSKRHKKRKRRG